MKVIFFKLYKNKMTFLLLIGITIICCLSIFKNERVIYLPFNIPGKQMAITIPPFGMFIESRYKKEGSLQGSVLSHERIHWAQFRRMGLFSFYYQYFLAYSKFGRGGDNWMEREAATKSHQK